MVLKLNAKFALVLKGAGAFLLPKILTVIAEMAVIYINNQNNISRRDFYDPTHRNGHVTKLY